MLGRRGYAISSLGNVPVSLQAMSPAFFIRSPRSRTPDGGTVGWVVCYRVRLPRILLTSALSRENVPGRVSKTPSGWDDSHSIHLVRSM